MIPNIGDTVWLIYADWVIVVDVDKYGFIKFKYKSKLSKASPAQYRTIKRMKVYTGFHCRIKGESK